MSYPIEAWFNAFVCTQLVEVPVYVLAMRHAVRTGHAERPRTLPFQILLAFGASAITHPMVWYVIPRVPSSFRDPMHAWVEYLVRAETFAFLVEAFYFYSCHVVWLRRALAWSFAANALSVAIGFLLRYLIGWP